MHDIDIDAFGDKTGNSHRSAAKGQISRLRDFIGEIRIGGRSLITGLRAIPCEGLESVAMYVERSNYTKAPEKTVRKA